MSLPAGSASRNETDFPTNLLTNPTGERIGTNFTNAEIVGRQPLFNRDNDARIGQADAQLQTAQADLQTAEDELIVRVAQTYFDVLVAQDALAAAQANRAANGEQLASAKRNFEVGTATITDTREAQARFDLGTRSRDCRRERPAHQTCRARPAGRAQQCRAQALGGAGGVAGARTQRDRRPGCARRRRSIRAFARPISPWRLPSSRPKGRVPATCPRSTRWPAPAATA